AFIVKANRGDSEHFPTMAVQLHLGQWLLLSPNCIQVETLMQLLVPIPGFWFEPAFLVAKAA
ncbi:hypothetical protein OGM63_18945, partial [Plectonema radiosum NIES-515]